MDEASGRVSDDGSMRRQSLAHRNRTNASSHSLEVLGEDMMMTTGEEVVVEGEVEYDDGVSTPHMYEYDSSFHNISDQNALYELYQPKDLKNGNLICKICYKINKNVVHEYEDRQAFTYHRYKVHGSYNNSLVCPVVECREVFASMLVLRRHLNSVHRVPVEMQQRVFSSMAEFERWRHSVEVAGRCRFMMHTKQPAHRRQIMHCSRSEHKIVLQTKRHRLPRLRMAKMHACCPAHISFRLERNGTVDCHFQLTHCGHAESDTSTTDNPLGTTDEDQEEADAPMIMHFPSKPSYIGDRAMQYLQIDIVDIADAVYYDTIYTHVLIIRDVKTGYLFAKPLSDVSNPSNRQLLIRILTDIFAQFGVPDAFSCCNHLVLIRDVLSALGDVFRVQIKEILHDSLDAEMFRNMLIQHAELELQSKNRWVEMLQFTIMSVNQSGTPSPFERMFNRRPYNTPTGFLPPWFDDFEFDPIPDEEDSPDLTASLDQKYLPGEKVYIRNFVGIPGRGNVLPYLYGHISEVDSNPNNHFPYKVHYSRTNQPMWPNESTALFGWASGYDLLPITYDPAANRTEDQKRLIASLMCACTGDFLREEGDEGNTPACPLFRAYQCSNKMSRHCCLLKASRECKHHLESTDGDEQWPKPRSFTRTSNQRVLASDLHQPLNEPKREGMVEVQLQRQQSEMKPSSSSSDSTTMYERPARLLEAEEMEEAYIEEVQMRRGDEVPEMQNEIVIAENNRPSTSQMGNQAAVESATRKRTRPSILSTSKAKKTSPVKNKIKEEDEYVDMSDDVPYASGRISTVEAVTEHPDNQRRSQRAAKVKVFKDYVTGS